MPRKPQLKLRTRVVVLGYVAKVWTDERTGREMVTVVIDGTGHRETMPLDERYVRAEE